MKRNPPQSRRPSASSDHPEPPQFPSLDLSELARHLAFADSVPVSPTNSSPVALLPPELLSHVFSLSLPADLFPVPSTTQTPLLVSQVCSSWRSLALHLPSLWSAIHINYRDQQEDVPAVRLWLSRSGSLPLSISLSVDFNDLPQQAILDTICAFAPRWYNIRFDFRHLLCPSMYHLDTAVANIPMLHSFHFHTRDLSADNVAPITQLLSYTPSLRKVTWVDDLADIDSILSLPLPRLTHLTLSMDQGSFDYLQVLNQCYNLEHLHITKPLPSLEIPDHPIFLDKLTSIHISSSLTSIFDHLILPALSHVTIQAENDKGPAGAVSHLHLLDYLMPAQPASSSSASCPIPSWDPAPLLYLIDRSACQISSLSLEAPMSEDALLTCLHRISPSLQSLVLKEGVTVGDQTLQAFTITNFNDEELPPFANLQDLHIDTPITASQAVLSCMLRSRLSSASPLGSLRLQEGHEDLEDIRAFVTTLGTKFSLEVIPRKTIPAKSGRNARNWVYKRKVCASR